MNPLYFLVVAELFVIGWMWHDKPARSEDERDSGKPDPAVLFSRKRKEHRQNPQERR